MRTSFDVALEGRRNLMGKALRRLGNRETAEELVQGFLLKLWEKPFIVDETKAPLTFVLNAFDWHLGDFLLSVRRKVPPAPSNDTADLGEAQVWARLLIEKFVSTPAHRKRAGTLNWILADFTHREAARSLGVSSALMRERYKAVRQDLRKFAETA